MSTDRSPIKTARLLLWALVALAVAAFVYLLLKPAPEPHHQGQAHSSEAGMTLGGPFTLTDGAGKPFSSAALAGKPYAIFFGFTHCPDVCPTTLARLVKLRRQAGAGDDALNILFVSVDPERDTPVEVGRYTGLFNAPVVGLTGSPAQIEQVKKQFGIYSEKVGSGLDYSVNHTTTTLLFDRSGKFVATISPEENDVAAMAKLKRLIEA